MGLLRVVPMLTVFIPLITVAACYYIGAYEHHFHVWLPYLSTVGEQPPESTVFTFGMGCKYDVCRLCNVCACTCVCVCVCVCCWPRDVGERFFFPAR
jgi:hypothetical protein